MRKYIFSAIWLFSLTVCASAPPEIYVETLHDPLISYRKGHYRNVIELFEADPSIADSAKMQYLKASAYKELRDNEKALEAFQAVDSSALYKENKELFPFFVRKYVQTLTADNAKLDSESLNELLAMAALVDKDSPIRPYLENELFTVLWDSEDYEAVANSSKNLSPQGRAWAELAKNRLGRRYNITPIIQAQRAFTNNLAYSNITESLDAVKFRKADELTNLAAMMLRIPEQRDKALEFAGRYRDLSKDNEYYALFLSEKLFLDGSQADSYAVLTDYIKDNPDASLDFYTKSYEYFVKRKQYDTADDTALAAYNKYGKSFYNNTRSSIEFHRNPDYVLDWYKNNYTNITADQHLQVMRALIRNDLNKAAEAGRLGVSVNKDTDFRLIYALVNDELGKEKEAYSQYLELAFEAPFAYAGIISSQKEKALREKYREIFDEYSGNILKALPSRSLEDRLMLYKFMLADGELPVDKAQMAKDQEAFNKIVYADLNKAKTIPILEKYPQSLKNFAPETQDYAENAVLGSARGLDIARAYYKYRDIFINSDIEGYLTFRLYFYIRERHGYTYLLNYPDDILELVFPKPEFELITEWSGSEELAYWMLASFMAESHFRKRVFSQVGAVGFAQVMPYTAVDIKRWMRMPELSNYDFYDNMRMGVFYHKRMHDQLGGDILLSMAAYNAGPGAVARWKRKFPHIKDIHLFTEAIEYGETRNYVKIINYNHSMYKLMELFRQP